MGMEGDGKSPFFIGICIFSSANILTFMNNVGSQAASVPTESIRMESA